MILDGFAGPGGWDEGLRLLGRTDVVGIEWDRDDAYLELRVHDEGAGIADTANLLATDSSGGQDAANGSEGGVGPVVGILLCPQGLVHYHVAMRLRDSGDQLTLGVQENGAGTTGADIDA